MAIFVIIKAILALSALSVGYFVLMPLTYQLFNGSQWDNITDPDTLDRKNNMYEMISWTIPILFPAIIIFAYLAATRRQTVEL